MSIPVSDFEKPHNAGDLGGEIRTWLKKEKANKLNLSWYYTWDFITSIRDHLILATS